MRSTWGLLALLACTSGPAAEEPNEAWAFAVARPDCAPWDGAATSVRLSNTPDDSLPAMPSLVLAAYRGVEGVAGHRFRLGEGGADGASATFCAAADACEAAGAGWVEFAPGATGAALAGRYDLTFPDGTRRSGRFSAPVLERRALCG